MIWFALGVIVGVLLTVALTVLGLALNVGNWRGTR